MKGARLVAGEALAVAAFAVVVALMANAVSPRGLRLGRDYFPNAPTSDLRAPVVPPDQTASGTATSPVAGGVMQRLARHGFSTVTAEEALALLRDPQAQAGLTVFVDARDEAKYHTGHIPGAWPFDHYRAEESLPAVLPACLGALKVVVYCTGGDCEDSEFAAVTLRDAGVPAENLAIFIGGIAEWSAKKFPVETGVRGSGEMASSDSP